MPDTGWPTSILFPKFVVIKHRWVTAMKLNCGWKPFTSVLPAGWGKDGLSSLAPALMQEFKFKNWSCWIKNALKPVLSHSALVLQIRNNSVKNSCFVRSFSAPGWLQVIIEQCRHVERLQVLMKNGSISPLFKLMGVCSLWCWFVFFAYDEMYFIYFNCV